MKNIWSTIFTKAVVDGSTNSLSLFDAIEEITVTFSNPEDVVNPKKNIPISFAIVSLWSEEISKGQRKFDHLIEIIDPQGKKLNEFLNTPAFEDGKKRLRTITQMNGLTVTTEGEYTIVVKYKMGKGEFIEVSRIPLDVRFILNAPIGEVGKKK